MQHSFTSRKITIASIALLLACLTACTPKPTKQNPNFILLMGDDHGWEETGYNDHPYLITPVLDEMAATGLRLDRFYSASPVCSPTRGSVITGRHPNRYGTFAPNWSIRPEEVSIAQLLGDAGYACGHFGKWHLGPVKGDSPTNPGAMGFEEWLSHDNFFEIDPTLSRNGGPPEKFHGESSEIVIDEALRFIDKAKESERPFFIVVWFGSPHEPYSGLEQDLALYQNLPESFGERLVSLTSMETGLQVGRPLDEVLQERYAEITAMDRAIGHLRQQLVDKDLKDNTLLWYCGDNGIPSSGLESSSLRGQKGQIYEGGSRVPGLIEWPSRITEQRTTDVNAVTSDMLPTLCDLAGIALPDRPLDGISLKPLIDGNMTERPSPICFWSYDTQHEMEMELEPYIDPILQVGTTPLVKIMDGRFTRNFRNFLHPETTERDYSGPRAIVDNRYKLVINDRQGGDPQKELFDLRNDPAEQNDLIETRGEIAQRLELILLDWQRSVLKSLTGANYLSDKVPDELKIPNYRTTDLEGIGYDLKLERQDPSNVIKVDDSYYVWYAQRDTGLHSCASTIYYATSEDGLHWRSKGEAIGKGKKGEWDSFGVITPYVAAINGKYYLYYTGTSVEKEFVPRGPDATLKHIGVALADNPDGPWKKFGQNPVLSPGQGDVWDNVLVDDAHIIVRNGKYWFYYKGDHRSGGPRNTKWGLAIGDQPTGPFVRHAGNPLIGGHTVCVWPHRDGVAALVDKAGPERFTVQWSPDGIHFERAARLGQVHTGCGPYDPDAFTDTENGGGISWGVAQHRDPSIGKNVHIIRFDVDMEVP